MYPKVFSLLQLLNHNVVNDLILLEPLLDALTALEKDSSLLVRVLALRGLGNVASGSPEKVGAAPRVLGFGKRGMDFWFCKGKGWDSHKKHRGEVLWDGDWDAPGGSES